MAVILQRFCILPKIPICQCKVFCGDKEGLNASLFCFFQDFSLFGNIARTWYLASLKGKEETLPDSLFLPFWPFLEGENKCNCEKS